MRDPILTSGDEEQKRQPIQTACVADRITEGDADASIETTDSGLEALQRDVSLRSVLAGDPKRILVAELYIRGVCARRNQNHTQDRE